MQYILLCFEVFYSLIIISEEEDSSPEDLNYLKHLKIWETIKYSIICSTNIVHRRVIITIAASFVLLQFQHDNIKKPAFKRHFQKYVPEVSSTFNFEILRIFFLNRAKRCPAIPRKCSPKCLLNFEHQHSHYLTP